MNKNIVIGVLVATTLLFAGLYYKGSHVLGAQTGPTHLQQESFNGGLQIGARGTVITQSLTGTCNLQTGTASFAATSTAQFNCAVTGVQSGDLVLADLPVGAGINGSGSGSPFAGFVIVSAYATTSNAIGVTIANFTGAATSTYPQATTSVEYRVIR